jgi:RNA polymerase sigma-70 factor (ECF subfamily)
VPKADPRRFKALIEPHLDALFRAAYRLTRNRADAEDLVQDTCIRGYLRLDDLREHRPKAWLLRVLHNAFVDSARRAKSSPIQNGDASALERSFASLDRGPEDSACTSQREDQLQRAWLSLDRGQRALLSLRAEGYTLDEIAEITGLAMDALTMRLYRARRRFAGLLRESELTTRKTGRAEVSK